MSAQKKTRPPRAPTRRKGTLKPGGRQVRAGGPDSRNAEQELLRLVRAGVEEFILKSATVEDFARMVHLVMKKEQLYEHQLTRSVFAKIVKDAVSKQKRLPIK